jgi:hypothetical protein
MPDDPKLTAMREHYDRGRELERLGESCGQLEFERTKEITLRALAEVQRVVRRGGSVFVAAISRWATRMHGILRLRLYEAIPGAEAELAAIERTGRLPPLRAGSFCGYVHRPDQLQAELAASGLQVMDLVSVEGPAYLLDDLAEHLADDEDRRVVMETARALERVPELLGIGPHLLATARK